MNTCPFKVGETYETRRGHSATVLHVGKPDRNFPLLCIHIQGDEENPISHRYDGREFYNQNGPNDLIPPAPPMKRVPLGPEDVPPGSVVSSHPDPDEDYSLVYSWTRHGFRVSGFSCRWEDCVNDVMKWKPPGGTWQPMWKEVPEEGGEG